MWKPRQVGSRHVCPALGVLAAESALTLRAAQPDDAARIERLAALDSSSPPAPPVLLAEADGEIWVAVSLTDLRAIADPFRPTAQVRALALARAEQLHSAVGALGRFREVGRASSRRLRLVTGAD